MLITSKENPAVKLFIKLKEQKKARAELGLFVIEGIRICTDALNENVKIASVLYTEQAYEKYSETVSKLCEKAYDGALCISEEIATKLSDTKTPQGVFCVLETLDKKTSNGKIDKIGKYLILNNLQDPGNVGTILRVADAVGLNGVFLCNCCDIYNPKTVRSTMGSLFRMPICTNMSYSEIITAFKELSVPTYASVIDTDALNLRSVDFGESCAVVIGNEGNGLSLEDANACDFKLTIRMHGNINSLNAAAAAGIIMWEMTK